MKVDTVIVANEYIIIHNYDKNVEEKNLHAQNLCNVISIKYKMKK